MGGRVCSAGGPDWSCERAEPEYPIVRGMCRGHYNQTRKGLELSPIRDRAPHLEDLTGTRFGNMQVVAEASRRRKPSGQSVRMWLCSCICNGPLTEVRHDQIKAAARDADNERSCGCLQYVRGPSQNSAKNGMKRCTCCSETKSVSEFHSNSTSWDRLQSQCKACGVFLARISRFGLSRSEYLAIHRDRCDLCDKSVEDNGRSLSIDHFHGCCDFNGSCGLCVRGCICTYCNVHLLPGYEALPERLRTLPWLNEYLDRRPIQELRLAKATN